MFNRYDNVIYNVDDCKQHIKNLDISEVEFIFDLLIKLNGIKPVKRQAYYLYLSYEIFKYDLKNMLKLLLHHI